MNILGIACWYHDAAAALLRDGKIVAAAAEERFTRQKHDFSFPKNAIKWALDTSGITADDLDYVVFYEKPLVKFERILASYVTNWPRSFRAYITAMPLWLKRKLWFKREVRKEFGYRGEVLYADHHLSHACAAYLCSPFDEAAVLTVDGVGEWNTTAWGHGEGSTVSLDAGVRFPHSLGLLYSAVTAHLRFRVNNDEYKVMGLASYGERTYADEMDRLMTVHDDGSFEMDMRYFAYHYGLQMLSGRGRKLLGPAREPESEIDQRHCDIAASLQAKLEDAMVGITSRLHERTGSRNLCMAGGVALNCVANRRILERSGFENLFVQPAAGDDGGALGACLWAWNMLLENEERWTFDHAYLGPEFSDEEIEQVLRDNGAPYRTVGYDGIPAKAAELVAQDRIVGWFQGRLEWGPRALGSRSILANACNPDMKDILNARVKHREAFRPFAPVMPAEVQDEYIDLPVESPYMLIVGDVVEDKHDKVPAITHTDGTARPQSVRREVNPLYYDTLREFERITGVPVMVNTSFNVRGEPIVCTPQDAFNCFAGTGIDDLVIGPFWVRKEDIGEAE